MNISNFSDMSLMEMFGNLALSLMIGSEAFVMIGGTIWAALYYTPLGGLAKSIAFVIGGGAGLFAAIWIYRLAMRQRVANESEQHLLSGTGG